MFKFEIKKKIIVISKQVFWEKALCFFQQVKNVQGQFPIWEVLQNKLEVKQNKKLFAATNLLVDFRNIRQETAHFHGKKCRSLS